VAVLYGAGVSDGFSVDCSEVYAMARELESAGAKADREKSRLLDLWAGRLYALAVSSAPVRTGELRGSIYNRGEGDDRRVGSDVRQGFFQEFGTSVMSPQPWIWIHVPSIHRGLDADMEKIGDPFA
jgi:hypothetical protein